MTVTLEIYHILIIVFALCGALWTFFKIFFSQFEKRLKLQFDTIDAKFKDASTTPNEIHRLELEAERFKYHVAETYVKHDALEAFRREMRDMFDKVTSRLDEMVRAA